MLYTTEQISKMYSGEEKNITPYMITHTWIQNGLKHIRGKGKGYLFKKEWVEEYIENQAIENKIENKKTKIRITKGTGRKVCKVY